jgi:ankyrin repeat protein
MMAVAFQQLQAMNVLLDIHQGPLVAEVHVTASLNRPAALNLLLSHLSQPGSTGSPLFSTGLLEDILLRKDDSFSTPLHKAAGKGNLEAIKELFRHDTKGLAALSEDRNGHLPLHCAVENGRLG